MKRVLFVSYTSEWTGPTNSLLLLLRGLRTERDVQVLLPGRGAFTQELEREGIPFHAFRRLDKWDLPRVFELLRREPFHLLYANTTHGSSRNAMLAAAALGVPSICHVREMGWGKGWASLGFLRLARRAVAVSRAAGESVARFLRSGALRVVHNGVPESILAPPAPGLRERIRAEMGARPGSRVVLQVGHLCRRKGQLHAIRALSRLPPGMDVRLWLVGSLDREPDYVEAVSSLVDREGLRERVRILGFRRDVLDLRHGADAALHPAVADPQPRSVIEAMAAGLPVVAFGVDGVVETVVHERTGLLVPAEDEAALADGLRRLLNRPDEAAEMGERGRERVRRNFLAAHTVGKVRDVIAEVIGPDDVRRDDPRAGAVQRPSLEAGTENGPAD